VYSETERVRDGTLAWWQRPAVLGATVLVLTVVLNVIFF
jgi:hypothetical protein